MNMEFIRVRNYIVCSIHISYSLIYLLISFSFVYFGFEFVFLREMNAKDAAHIVENSSLPLYRFVHCNGWICVGLGPTSFPFIIW
jgi:hypothetical protein